MEEAKKNKNVKTTSKLNPRSSKIGKSTRTLVNVLKSVDKKEIMKVKPPDLRQTPAEDSNARRKTDPTDDEPKPHINDVIVSF